MSITPPITKKRKKPTIAGRVPDSQKKTPAPRPKKPLVKGEKVVVKQVKLKKDGTPSRRGEGGGPPLGSKNHEKFKDDKSKQELFVALIEHLEAALDTASFEPCDWETVQRYCAEYPDIFNAERIGRARRRGRQVIEKMLMSSAMGKLKGAQPASIIFLAKNKINYRDKMQLSGDAKNPLAIADNATPAEAMSAYEAALNGED